MRAIDYFDKSANFYADRSAIVDGDRSYSYSVVCDFRERLARAMWASGLKREERAAIYSQNHPAVLFCMLGILRAGAAWVPINFRNAADAYAAAMTSTQRRASSRSLLVSSSPRTLRANCAKSDPNHLL